MMNRRNDGPRRPLTVNDIPTAEFVPVTATKLSVPKLSDSRAIDLGAAFSKFLIAPSPEHLAALYRSPAKHLAEEWQPPCVDTLDESIGDVMLKQLKKSLDKQSSSSSSSPTQRSSQSRTAPRRNPTRQQLQARAAEEMFLEIQAFYKRAHEDSVHVHDELAVNTGINIAEFFLLEQGFSRSFCRQHQSYRKLPSLGLFLLRLLVTEGSVISRALAPRELPSLQVLRDDFQLATGLSRDNIASAQKHNHQKDEDTSKRPVSILDQRRRDNVMERLRNYVNVQEQKKSDAAQGIPPSLSSISLTQLNTATSTSPLSPAALSSPSSHNNDAGATGSTTSSLAAIEAAKARLAEQQAQKQFQESMQAQVSWDWDRATTSRSREQISRWSGSLAVLMATIQKALPEQGNEDEIAGERSGVFGGTSHASSNFPAVGGSAAALAATRRKQQQVGKQTTTTAEASTNDTTNKTTNAAATSSSLLLLQQQHQRQGEALHLVHKMVYPDGNTAREAFENCVGGLTVGSKVLLPPLARFQGRKPVFPVVGRSMSSPAAGGFVGGGNIDSSVFSSTMATTSGGGERDGDKTKRAGGGGLKQRRRRESVMAQQLLGVLPDVGLLKLPKVADVLAEQQQKEDALNNAAATAAAASQQQQPAKSFSAAATAALISKNFANPQDGSQSAAKNDSKSQNRSTSAPLPRGAMRGTVTEKDNLKLAMSAFDYTSCNQRGKTVNIYVECAKNNAFSLKHLCQDLRSAKAKQRAAQRGGADIASAFHLLQKFAGSNAKKRKMSTSSNNSQSSLSRANSFASSSQFESATFSAAQSMTVDALTAAADGVSPLGMGDTTAEMLGFANATSIGNHQQQQQQQQQNDDDGSIIQQQSSVMTAMTSADDQDAAAAAQEQLQQQQQQQQEDFVKQQQIDELESLLRHVTGDDEDDEEDDSTNNNSPTTSSPAHEDPYAATLNQSDDGNNRSSTPQNNSGDDQQQDEEEDADEEQSQQKQQQQQQENEESTMPQQNDASHQGVTTFSTETEAFTSTSAMSRARRQSRVTFSGEEQNNDNSQQGGGNRRHSASLSDTAKQQLATFQFAISDMTDADGGADAHDHNNNNNKSNDDPVDESDVSFPVASQNPQKQQQQQQSTSSRVVMEEQKRQISYEDEPADEDEPDPNISKDETTDLYLLRPFITAEFLGFDIETNRLNFRVANDARPKRNVENFWNTVVDDLADAEDHAETMFHRLATRFLRAHCCPKHRALQLSHYCQQCDIFVCESCVVETHAGHEVTARSAYCTQKIAALEPMREMFQKRIALLQSLKTQVATDKSKLLDSVNKALSECRNGLETRKATLRADAVARGKRMAEILEDEKNKNRVDAAKLRDAMKIVQDEQRRGLLKFAPFVELHLPVTVRNDLDLLLPSKIVHQVIQSLGWSLAAKHLTRIVYPSPAELEEEDAKAKKSQQVPIALGNDRLAQKLAMQKKNLSNSNNNSTIANDASNAIAASATSFAAANQYKP